MNDRFVEIIVEQPKGSSNEYAWDERAQRIRFVRRGGGAAPAAFEEGRIANTLDADGEPLLALLAITCPTFPGCEVIGRVIGALELVQAESTHYRVVAVADGDPDLARAYSVDSLPEAERLLLTDSLLGGARWLEEEESAELIQHAKERARLSRVGRPQNAAGLRPWEVAAALEKAPELFDEKSHFTWAEYALSTLPLRFQNYARELLLHDERILLWVYRPLMTRGERGVFRKEVLRAGLAILTDREFLWMVDPTTPNPNIEGYGYVARMFALERLQRAVIEIDGAGRKLILAVSNGRGETERFAIQFPGESERELNELIQRLNAFVPLTPETRLARVTLPQPSADKLRDPMTKDAAQTEVTVKRLRGRLRQTANGERVFSQAFVPEWGEGGAQLVTLTDRALYWTPGAETRGKTAVEVRIPLETIGTVELCNSQLGAWFRVWLPTERRLEEWKIPIPPILSTSFLRVAVALRDLVATPSTAMLVHSGSGTAAR